MLIQNDNPLYFTLTDRCTGLLKCHDTSLLVVKSLDFSSHLLSASALINPFSNTAGRPTIQNLGQQQPLGQSSFRLVGAWDLFVVKTLSLLLILEINPN